MVDYETEDRIESISRTLKKASEWGSEANENIMYIWEEIRLIKERLNQLEAK